LIVSRDNPLTARVAVNRYWQQLWVGLVKTVDDFGSQGERLVQLELLDQPGRVHGERLGHQGHHENDGAEPKPRQDFQGSPGASA
jgi:hypothetical protein